MKIIEIYRGSGLTELKAVEEDYENVSENHEQGSGDLPDAATNKLHRNKSTVKGYYRGRDGITVLFDRLLCSGRKNKK